MRVRLLTSSATCNPVIPGMRISRKARSGACCAIAWQALGPSSTLARIRKCGDNLIVGVVVDALEPRRDGLGTEDWLRVDATRAEHDLPPVRREGQGPHGAAVTAEDGGELAGATVVDVDQRAGAADRAEGAVGGQGQRGDLLERRQEGGEAAVLLDPAEVPDLDDAHAAVGRSRREEPARRGQRGHRVAVSDEGAQEAPPTCSAPPSAVRPPWSAPAARRTPAPRTPPRSRSGARG